MGKTVTLHVGLSKTGSTSIQTYLRKHYGKLRSVGILYPGLREHEALVGSTHPMMLNAMTGRISAPSECLNVQACREVVALVFRIFRESDLANLIWSYETMAMSIHNWDAHYLAKLFGGVDVRVLFFARFMDDWIESFYRQNIWERAGPRAEALAAKPLPLLAPPSLAREGAGARPGGSLLRKCSKMIESLRTMRKILPSADIVVRSFDADREKGTVVSGALAAMGLPVESAFRDADDEAGAKNPTKSDLSSMLLFHLITAQAGPDVLRQVAAAAGRRDGECRRLLTGRRFRFLSDEDALRARDYYKELREEYPHLPAQPPYMSEPAERRLPREDAIALLDWLRPDISDAVFDKACAAYPSDRGA